MQKASRISEKIDQVTIGPDSTPTNEVSHFSENIENERNSCNVQEPKKNHNLSSNNVSSRGGLIFSIKKILYENNIQRKEEVRVRFKLILFLFFFNYSIFSNIFIPSIYF